MLQSTRCGQRINRLAAWLRGRLLHLPFGLWIAARGKPNYDKPSGTSRNGSYSPSRRRYPCMGTISFLLPSGLSPEATRALERACLAGGPDNMPWPTDARVENGRLTLRRSVDESGYLVVPWQIADAGLLMAISSTLMERLEPYDLTIELARGKVN